MKNIRQHDIDAAIQTACETKIRHGYTEPAAVHKLWYGPGKFTLGFNFRAGAAVGEIYTNPDGSREEVLAIV